MTKRTDIRKSNPQPALSPIRILLWWTLAILWLTLVSYVSLIPAPPGLPYLIRVSNLFSDSKQALQTLQGVLHLTLYALGTGAVLMACAAVLPTLSRVRLSAIALVLVMFAGGIIELLQENVLARASDVRDVMANLVGVLLFLGVAWATALGPFHRPSAARAPLRPEREW